MTADSSRDDRPLKGGGHAVDHSAGDREKVRAADDPVTPAKGYNLVIWIFLALLVAAIVLALVGGLFT